MKHIFDFFSVILVIIFICIIIAIGFICGAMALPFIILFVFYINYEDKKTDQEN